MSVFIWKASSVMGIIFVLFVISVITVTLLLVNEIRSDNIDATKVNFIEVSNWIFVGFLGLCFILFLMMTPLISKYIRLKNRRYQSVGLTPASKG